MDVNGSNTAPVYKYLKSAKGSMFGDSIKWNFSKFLVDKDGQVVDRYAPTTSPLSIEVTKLYTVSCFRLREVVRSIAKSLFLFIYLAERYKEASGESLILQQSTS